MRINTEVEKYLAGATISNGEHFTIPRTTFIARDALLLELSRDKSVLHVGCADHLELIEQKRRKGTYLHDKLASCANELIGADTNTEAILAMQAAGIRNIIHVDNLPSNKHYDVVLVPDVIEHVANVNQFLEWIKTLDFSIAVITTPNALRLENRFLFREEFINTDHRYWFSPYTLCKCIVSAGLTIRTIHYTDRFYLLRPISNLLKFFFPVTRDGIAVIITKT